LWPFRLNRSWVLSRLGLGSPPTRVVGIVLVVMKVVGFLATGVGLLADQGWWEGTAVILRWPSATYVGN